MSRFVKEGGKLDINGGCTELVSSRKILFNRIWNIEFKTHSGYLKEMLPLSSIGVSKSNNTLGPQIRSCKKHGEEYEPGFFEKKADRWSANLSTENRDNLKKHIQALALTFKEAAIHLSAQTTRLEIGPRS